MALSCLVSVETAEMAVCSTLFCLAETSVEPGGHKQPFPTGVHCLIIVVA